MNIHDHPNAKRYLAHFLLNLQKHATLEETTLFDVEIREEGLGPDELDLLR